MTITLMAVALCWGFIVGYLLLRGLDSLLGLGFCVHGLFARRWKKLADKNATGLVRIGPLVKLTLRLCVYLLFAGFILDSGDGFVRRTYHFSYADAQGVLFVVAAGAMCIGRFLTSVRRLKLVWRMSHEFDFAERRERTQRLKS